jgi:CBS domain-containing membrane protein
LLDVDPADLEALLRETHQQAYARRFGAFTCADIMSRALVTITPSTSVEAARALLERHRIKALPVLDDARRLTGIVTRTDLARAAASMSSPTTRWQLALRRFFNSAQPDDRRVAPWMTTDVRTVTAATPLSELIPRFADYGHHHLPVIDTQDRLVGMVTETDVISGLSRLDDARRSA